MIAATYGTVEDIEILWVILALVGLVYSAINVTEAAKDYRFVQERRIANGRRVLAWSHLVSESLRAGVLFIFLVIGVLAMFFASPPTGQVPRNVTIAMAVTRWGLIASSAMLVLKTYIAKKARDQIRRGGPTRLTDDGTNPKESVS